MEFKSGDVVSMGVAVLLVISKDDFDEGRFFVVSISPFLGKVLEIEATLLAVAAVKIGDVLDLLEGIRGK